MIIKSSHKHVLFHQCLDLSIMNDQTVTHPINDQNIHPIYRSTNSQLTIVTNSLKIVKFPSEWESKTPPFPQVCHRHLLIGGKLQLIIISLWCHKMAAICGQSRSSNGLPVFSLLIADCTLLAALGKRGLSSHKPLVITMVTFINNILDDIRVEYEYED